MKKSKKKRVGRPAAENPATERLPMVRVTPDSLKRYQAAADRAGMKFSAWVRKQLDKGV